MRSFVMFIFGAIAGATGAVLATKYVCDAKAEAKIATATAEARNFYKEKYEGDAKKFNEKVDKKAFETITKTYQPGDSNRIFGNTYEVKVQELNDYRMAKPDPNKNKPYLSLVDPNRIDAGYYDNYEQYSLDYYQDGTLVDQQDNPIDNPIEIAGDFLDDLGLDNPEIYVANDVTKTVYNICYVAASFDQPGGEYD